MRKLTTEEKMVVMWIVIAKVGIIVGLVGVTMIICAFCNALDVVLASTLIYLVGGILLSIIGFGGEKFIITRLIDKKYIDKDKYENSL